MWSDNETTIDMIGFNVHAELMKNLICKANLLPITIGVFGDWGSGKTSVLKMLEKSLEPENASSKEEKELLGDTVCLYFNSWTFEGYDDAKSAMISSILTQLSKHKKFGEKIKDNVENLFKSVNWMRILKVGAKELIPYIGTYLTGIPMIPPTFFEGIKKLVRYIIQITQILLYYQILFGLFIFFKKNLKRL